MKRVERINYTLGEGDQALGGEHTEHIDAIL